MTEPATPSDVPEADSPVRPIGDREANEADVLEQQTDVPLDEDDVLT